MSWQLVLAILPWLALLACPVVMLWMMRGGAGGKACGKARGAERAASEELPSPADRADEIALLEARLARLKADGSERTLARDSGGGRTAPRMDDRPPVESTRSADRTGRGESKGEEVIE